MRMVVSDLDGTLLKSDKSISEKTLQILGELEAKNIVFMIATARARRHIHNLLPFNFDNMYCINYNGAEIYHGSELIYNNYLEGNVAKYIVKWLQETYQGINVSLEISNRLFTNFDIKVMDNWSPPYTQVDFSTFEYKPTAKILVDLRYISDTAQIMEMLPDNCRMIITDGGTLGQIAHKDVSKINAVKSLAKSFGYGLEEVIAFGDDYNDIEMIRECGIGVAMGNAPQKVKEAADIIAGTNDEDGVAMELERIIKGSFHQRLSRSVIRKKKQE